MIITELFMEREDGTRLVRTYSSDGKYIVRDGEVYEEAIDPEEFGRQYEESDELIPTPEEPEDEPSAEVTGE